MAVIHAPRPGRVRHELSDRVASVFELCAPFGGVLSGHDAAEALRQGHSQPISLLARWIVDRSVMHFNWRAGIFLPRFQFETDPHGAKRLLPMEGIQGVLAEFDGIFDDWEQVEWFATPNSWLHWREPARVIAHDPEGVAQAARADRYIARGW